ncbi:GntR family transcriptional regulator [Mesorhizobium sp. DCY119]|jgi:DNA-binding GntR family transcriptional regulator|uniref:GntR family transcriptional regulator n=1 Tax=Mesorhizobium sp. DCY119 TaxID=2108445 RepID=UPI000E740278|nr:GntR family transcriptional regulator [Mesorhizobium sp. DCY119]RJG41058.1 GntR family transcriptional regulator [Mesorhizobium sp. DCY119]
MTIAKRSLRVDRPEKTLRELALESLRDAILDSHFKPGVRLVERDLCTQLGVSRTIVREVLRHLESEGLVATVGTRGPVVAETTADQALQIYEIRGALEGMAAKLCAQKQDDQISEDLQAALERIKAGYQKKKMDRVLAETTEFYRILFAGAEREVAWGIVSSLTARINRLRSMTIKTTGRDVEGPRQMQHIVDAIRSGDGEGAYRAAQDHITLASSIARQLLAETTGA